MKPLPATLAAVLLCLPAAALAVDSPLSRADAASPAAESAHYGMRIVAAVLINGRGRFISCWIPGPHRQP
jgi:hypothetical protein